MRTIVPTMVEVPLDNGTVWTGTEQELRSQHPTWLKYARIVKPSAHPVQQLDEADVEDFYDDPKPGRMPSSARRWQSLLGQQGNTRYQFHPDQVQTVIPPRRSAAAQQARETEEQPVARPQKTRKEWRGVHPLLLLGLGMILMLGAWQGLTALGNWWQLHNDDTTYGRPRTAQYDVVVGHNDDEAHKTHVVVINLNAHIIIIEVPGGDTSKSRIYSGPHLYGDGAELAVITLTFKDVNGDGLLDMLVNFQGGHLIYLNQKVNNVWQFVPQQGQ